MTENFRDYHIRDHCSLKFPRPQFGRMRHPDVRRTYATSFPHDSRQQQKLPGTIFLTVNILNKCEIPHHLESHNERILHMARRPYDSLTSVAQQIILNTARHPYDVLTAVAQCTYCQTSLRRTDCSHTTKTNLLRSYAMLAS